MQVTFSALLKGAKVLESAGTVSDKFNSLAGRYLIVFYIRKLAGTILPISARDMDDAERRYYERHR